MKRKPEDEAAEKPQVKKRWSVAEADMEPEIMEDLGVKKLGDENTWYCTDSSCDSTATTSTASPGRSFARHRAGSTLRENVIAASEPPRPALARCDASALDDSFFLYRRRLDRADENPFPKLPDEIVLHIFGMLNKQTLLRCALVCKKWRGLAYDESFWARLDLGNKTLGTGSMEYVLGRGTHTLRLAQAEVEDPILPTGPSPSKLQYLDLSMAVISNTALCTLLQCCHQLKKLSLEHVQVNDSVCKAIGNNNNLDTLNLAMCSGITTRGLGYIVVGCRRLTSLNLAWATLSEAMLDSCTQLLPKSIVRLNLSGCRKNLYDKHVKRIVKNCCDLVELDLSDATLISAVAVEAITKLACLEHLAVSRCYNIPTAAYSRLVDMPALLYLDVFSLMTDEALAVFQKTLSQILVNKFNNSSIARPTVGVRRTSIWGLRVRD